MDLETGDGDPNFSYGYVALAAEVEIDTELGLVRFPRIVCANDVGRAINPRLLEGQVQGAVVQAIGWCTVENFIEKDCIKHLLDPLGRRHPRPSRRDPRRKP